MDHGSRTHISLSASNDDLMGSVIVQSSCRMKRQMAINSSITSDRQIQYAILRQSHIQAIHSAIQFPEASQIWERI